MSALLAGLTATAWARPLGGGGRTEIRYALDRPLCQRLLAGEGDEDSVNLFGRAERDRALILYRWKIDLLNTGNDDTIVYALSIQYNNFSTTHLFAYTAGDPFMDAWRDILQNMRSPHWSGDQEELVESFARRAQWRFEEDRRDSQGRLELREIDGAFYVLTWSFVTYPTLENFVYRPSPAGSTLVCYFHHRFE